MKSRKRWEEFTTVLQTSFWHHDYFKCLFLVLESLIWAKIKTIAHFLSFLTQLDWFWHQLSIVAPECEPTMAFSGMQLALSESLAVILAREERRRVRERESRCIIQRGWEIMHHLCPYPSGPVRIDPQPLTFSDTQWIFQPLCHAQCISVHSRGCILRVFSARCSLTFPLDYTVQLRYAQFFFFNLYFVVAQIKGQTFLLCEMLLPINTICKQTLKNGVKGTFCDGHIAYFIRR